MWALGNAEGREEADRADAEAVKTIAVIVSRERIKEIVSLWKHWNAC